MSKPILLFIACSCVSLCSGQATLIPEWSHTWPFGQEGGLFYRPAEEDNHLAVDPTTGNVFVTVDDMLQQVSPRFDFLFTFSSDGTDLTPVPTPLLGTVAPGMMDPNNLEGTNDLAARGGKAYHARELNTGGPGAGTTGSLCARNADGTSWKLGLGRAGYSYGEGEVLVDDEGAISIRSLNGTEAGVHATSIDGWPFWTTTLPGVVPFQDAVIIGDRIFGASSNWIWEIDRTTGAVIGGYTHPAGGSVIELATDGIRLFTVQMNGGGVSTWSCLETDGTVVWNMSADLDIVVKELSIDQFGRPWFIGNDPNGVAPPLLVVTASDGSSYETFTFGASMNDLAMGDDHAYITGAIPVGATYLIAVGTDLTTGVERTVVDPSVRLYPQPASTSLALANATVWRGSRVLDITGKAVAATVLSASTLDVSKLSEGVYFVEVRSAEGPVIKRFTVSR